jgi:hypothetical protein
VVLRVSDPDRAVEVLRALDGVGEVSLAEPGDGSPSGAVQADLADVPAAEAVRVLVGAGFAVSAVAPRNRLEDVFLALVDNDTTGSGTRDE